MQDHIRVLGIAPYENMKNLMYSLGKDFPQMELTLFVGDREKGLALARENFHGNYDVVISRGGTAQMLQDNLPLPVIAIELTEYDFLCSLRLAGGLDQRVAVVCADNIMESARRLRDIMNLDIDFFPYDSKAALYEIVQQISAEPYHAILCDMVAFSTAKTMGLLNAYLIISSVDNIRAAFQRAMLLRRSIEQLRNENLFIRELLQNQFGYTIILDDEGVLYLSTMESPEPELLDMLRKELPESIQAPRRRITRSLNSMLYIIRSQRITVGALSYTAFYFDVRKAPTAPNHMGIRYFTRTEVEARYCESIFSIAGAPTDAQSDIDHIAQSTAPVMITGEDGCGKASAVDLIFLRSGLKNYPLITINCALLGEKNWTFLLEHHNSPLTDADNTLYFVNADVLPEDRCRQLLSVLSDMQVCSRNRVFFSCICSPGDYLSQTGRQIADALCCMTLSLPPLRKLSSRIPSMLNMYLSCLNNAVNKQVVGAEPQAVELIKQFSWPRNYSQFRRVLSDLVLTASGSIITAEAVRFALQKERHVTSFVPNAEDNTNPLDLNRPMEEIQRDIVRRVVQEVGGNQTVAAKRLGISRTTMWRYLNQ